VQEAAGYAIYCKRRKTYYSAWGRCVPFRVYSTLKGAEKIAEHIGGSGSYSWDVEIRKVFIEVPQ